MHFRLCGLISAFVLIANCATGPRKTQRSSAPVKTSKVAKRGKLKNAGVTLKIEGNVRTKANELKNKIKCVEKNNLDREKIADDVKNLYAIGEFNDIKVSVYEIHGKTNVVFVVDEKPALRDVFVDGDEEVQKIQEVLNRLRGKPIGGSVLNIIRRTVIEELMNRGFCFAEVSLETKESMVNSFDLHVKIKKGHKVKIGKIEFFGNENLSAKQLKDNRILNAKNDLDCNVLRDTKGIDPFLIYKYYDKGFINVKIKAIKSFLSSNRKSVDLKIWIEEGEQYRLGKLKVTGAILQGKNDKNKKQQKALVKIAGLRSGEVFNRTRVHNATKALEKLCASRIKANCHVLPLTTIDSDARKIDLDLQSSKF